MSSEVQENTISRSDETNNASLDFEVSQTNVDSIETLPTSTTNVVEDLLDFESNQPVSVGQIEDKHTDDDDKMKATNENDSKSHANGGSIINHEKKVENSSVEEISSTSASPDNKEEIDLKSPLALWIKNHGVNNKVIKLIYWSDVKKSAVFFISGLIIMLALQCCSVIHVLTSLGLALLLAAFLYRIAMTIVNAVQKTSAEHPFKDYLEKEHKISEEAMQKIAVKVCHLLNSEIKRFQKLFLINDVVDSLKFGLCLWLASYIGSWFSLMTLAILGFVGLFTIPKVYEEKQAEIDNVFGSVKSKIADGYQIVEAKIPEKVKAYMNKKKQE